MGCMGRSDERDEVCGSVHPRRFVRVGPSAVVPAAQVGRVSQREGGRTIVDECHGERPQSCRIEVVACQTCDFCLCSRELWCGLASERECRISYPPSHTCDMMAYFVCPCHTQTCQHGFWTESTAQVCAPRTRMFDKFTESSWSALDDMDLRALFPGQNSPRWSEVSPGVPQGM